jgi:hypothetical protein
MRRLGPYDVAHVVGFAIAGVQTLPALSQDLQSGLHVAKAVNAPVNLGAMFVDQGKDMCTRRLTTFSEFDDFPNLGEGQADGLGRPDEREASEYIGVVIPIPAHRARRRIDDAAVLVVADRFRRYPTAPSELTDTHACILRPLTFHCAGRFNLRSVTVNSWAYLVADDEHVEPIARQPRRAIENPRVSLVHFDGCANVEVARNRLDVAFRLVGLDDVMIEYERVESAEEAEHRQFRGSPTILIDGHDPFAQESGPVGLACRLYRADDGADVAPSVAQLVAALLS